MITMSLNQLCILLNAKLVGDNIQISNVSIDSRSIGNDAIFVAISGKRFHGDDFLYQAIHNGAKALLVTKRYDVLIPQVIVNNTRIALGKLAAWVHKNCQTMTIAITGSCGKTTVKEMMVSILANKGKILYTADNFNNEIGVPLTLLRSTPQDDYAVIEIGANHVGEIAYSANLVSPDIALVNNVAEAHLEGFGSINAIKHAKGEIYQSLKSGAVAVINLDSHGGKLWDSLLTDKRVISFSQYNEKADVYASNILIDIEGKSNFLVHTVKGTRQIYLGIIGQHNVSNALASICLSLELGIEFPVIQNGLLNLIKVKKRAEVIELAKNIKLIDDSYNASVPSMKASIILLNNFKGYRWLILGNMTELGMESFQLHYNIANYANKYKFEYVLTYGKDAKIISDICHGIHFSSRKNMIEYIQKKLIKHDDRNHILLVKGANSTCMSKISITLKEYYL
ncbi:UDP-N-acetylmuramoyl-tripeptide--D-alanyl-D-alanine ligase [Candidatus Photodesmus katoptron]|uniref:UDP-N-acetylmuramoyl-tripeptide--D-alanyl-D-alanine ligase n=1 Tax=Candidatus Photodesmus katoptron Akat1 TaxID=1236703 RepID=S3E0N0_9GAMM|nr:UDP-N-acetylmuramoyl-tripeptide--D-alanyl-D-alanine ligase [Candidatus Photodesmus katoptron]EPE37726.1 UDP-N-acetylmuramoyl-tripeptide--D-alanyl-D-alanine ligase [Candidatus Photodesmus katoptron Akat1]KEY90552.1 UDP-N-acetylmuramoyl-tripeptide--D-alanyl-D-alanine ligase [Candidatus Photodesmus katoptron]